MQSVATHLLKGHLDKGVLQVSFIFVQTPWHHEQYLVSTQDVQSVMVVQLFVMLGNNPHFCPRLVISDAKNKYFY